MSENALQGARWPDQKSGIAEVVEYSESLIDGFRRCVKIGGKIEYPLLVVHKRHCVP